MSSLLSSSDRRRTDAELRDALRFRRPLALVATVGGVAAAVSTLLVCLAIGVVGWFAEGVRMQRAFARLMLAAILVYTALDVHTADWTMGNALYKGPGSLGPVIVDVLALVLWARLNIVRAKAA